ncbi:hypothetical protein BBP40_005970 [Aspergillus hancockii]|nr:hypothetical protein BBP40_005970 [Aspergillus hancockii]
MRRILQGANVGYGRNDFFLAASGSIAWDKSYSAMAKALANRHLIDDAIVRDADDAALRKMGEALDVSPSIVPVLLGGKCTYTAEHGKQIGWKAWYPPDHILEAADAEVELIVRDFESRRIKACQIG